jgi:hypothetical protein
MRDELEEAIDSLLKMPATSTIRLQRLADLLIRLLDQAGLPGAVGGTSGELSVPGLSRPKNGAWLTTLKFPVFPMRRGP